MNPRDLAILSRGALVGRTAGW